MTTSSNYGESFVAIMFATKLNVRDGRILHSEVSIFSSSMSEYGVLPRIPPTHPICTRQLKPRLPRNKLTFLPLVLSCPSCPKGMPRPCSPPRFFPGSPQRSPPRCECSLWKLSLGTFLLGTLACEFGLREGRLRTFV